MKYFPHTPGDVEKMTTSIGISSVDDLFSDIPRDKIINSLNLPPPSSELELVRRIGAMSERNRTFYEKTCFLGAGSYRHFSPAVVDSIISRSEFYTAYTPYQAEASQGILQSIFEYQTMISFITGMDVSNASLYDGSTACAEAVSLAANHTGKKEILYSTGLHPEYVEVLKTYFHHSSEVELKEIPLKDGVTCKDTVKSFISKDTAGVLIQNPNCLGFIENAPEIGRIAKEANKNALFIIVVNEPHSLGLLKNPKDCGADISVGEAASLGLPPSFGGPYLGFMAVKNALLRRMPGRLVGQTVDADGNRAFCLTLQAREQHIRREKATSNICTNQALCTLAATVYLSCLGKKGFVKLAKLNFEKAQYLKEQLIKVPGFKMAAEQPFFNEFTIICPDDPVKIDRYLHQKGIIGGFVTGRWRNEWKNYMTFCATELNTKKEIDDLKGYLETYCKEEVSSTWMIA